MDKEFAAKLLVNKIDVYLTGMMSEGKLIEYMENLSTILFCDVEFDVHFCAKLTVLLQIAYANNVVGVIKFLELVAYVLHYVKSVSHVLEQLLLQ